MIFWQERCTFVEVFVEVSVAASNLDILMASDVTCYYFLI